MAKGSIEALYSILMGIIPSPSLRQKLPLLVEVNGRRRSFLLQFSYPSHGVAVEVENPENEMKQMQCYDGDAYLWRRLAIEEAGWQLLTFNSLDVLEKPSAVEFYVRHALGLGMRTNNLESNVLPKLRPLASQDHQAEME